jgi:serine/threonine-protein kinase
MIGVRLGAWVIESEIGRGGMGSVYLARRRLGDGPDTAALKVLAAELAVEQGFQQRFQREIAILRSLDHPGIVRLFESGQSGPRFWYAMELVDGPNFDALRDERGRVSWPEVLEMAWQIAPALKHAHDRGVIHRDLKPANILRARNPEDPGQPGVSKLTDFGIASLFASPHLTVTGGIIGTPEYLSPEQAAGKPATKRSDLYSLGVVLYTLITGSTPFSGEPLDLLHKHRYAQFDRPIRIIPDLPPDLDEVICDLLEKDPSRRVPDAGVLHRRLDSLKRKLARQTQSLPAPASEPALEGREFPGGMGPATFAGSVVRQHLEEQNRGGPVQRAFNHPLVLVPLFALSLGALAWALWPPSAASMYARGAALMESDDPDDWEKAWDRHLGPLVDRFPNHPWQEEVAKFQEKKDQARHERQATRRAKNARVVSDAQWFFEKGLRQRRAGDEAGAQATWKALIDAYEGVPAERPWARRAREEMAKEVEADEKRLDALRDAIQASRQLPEARGKQARDALRALHAGDREALALIGDE